ncbi:fatty acid desaturase family protein [Ferrovibrio sp.]|uniref:fatty acid desaturase family protein n=1 Tax=Ferrovibrio sp. TaxID=1917215 RepID=UPI003511516A
MQADPLQPDFMQPNPVQAESAAKPVTARDLFSAGELARLGRRSDVVGAALVLHAWALIGGAMALFVAWPNPLTFIAAVMVIGGRQLGLAILMHDAAHGLLFRTRRWNEFAGQWLCAYPVGTDLHLYRPYHLKHHRFTQQADDPDLVLSAPFPVTRRSLWRKIRRDLTGISGLRRRADQWRGAWGGKGDRWTERRARLLRLGIAGGLGANLALFALLAALGYWWLYPALWLLPLFTWYQLVSRIRNIAEHAMVPDNDDALRNTRTTYAGGLTRLLLAPYWVNYHLEHHLALQVPCWRLPQAHRLLLGRGYGGKMEIRKSYAAVLRLAASAIAEGGSGPRAASVGRI